MMLFLNYAKYYMRKKLGTAELLIQMLLVFYL